MSDTATGCDGSIWRDDIGPLGKPQERSRRASCRTSSARMPYAPSPAGRTRCLKCDRAPACSRNPWCSVQAAPFVGKRSSLPSGFETME